MYQRGLGDRLLGLCVAFFIGTVLVYFGIQILLSIWQYIVALVSLGALIVLASLVVRARRERW